MDYEQSTNDEQYDESDDGWSSSNAEHVWHDVKQSLAHERHDESDDGTHDEYDDGWSRTTTTNDEQHDDESSNDEQHDEQSTIYADFEYALEIIHLGK